MTRVRACHYQDVPGHAGSCLRGLMVATTQGPQRWRECDRHRADRCPVRGWDLKIREEVNSRREMLVGSCPSCKGRHHTVKELLECQLQHGLDRALHPCPPALNQGSGQSLVPKELPGRYQRRAWRTVREAVVRRDERTCQECGKDLRAFPSWYLEVHHILPRTLGGTDHPTNLITLCIECHGRHTDGLTYHLSSGGRVLAQESSQRRKLSDFSEEKDD